ncbi:unnamed protein product [Blepharisma stoltei]|uniref:Uncharacterized protein n=1 Tax=Blepharisma stoltei TaxID=1481888 RepID=A0AAU9JPF2_9CILI|nr:unnamed protein product [Blepharisma stoltei]
MMIVKYSVVCNPVVPMAVINRKNSRTEAKDAAATWISVLYLQKCLRNKIMSASFSSREQVPTSPNQWYLGFWSVKKSQK